MMHKNTSRSYIAALTLFLITFLLSACVPSNNVFNATKRTSQSPQVVTSDKSAQQPGTKPQKTFRKPLPAPTEPPKDPYLKVEVGSHYGRIHVLEIDRKERFAVTAGSDKTIRIWSLPDLKHQKTLRVPISHSPREGQIFSLSISPDGKTIAASGLTGEDWDKKISIHIFDVLSGKQIARIPALEQTPYSLGFSDDGKYLAVGLLDKEGLRVFETTNWQEVARDSGYNAGVSSVDFGPQNRLVTTSGDGYVRLYNHNLRLVKKENLAYVQRLRTGYRRQVKPEKAKFSPDGKTIAVNDNSMHIFPDVAYINLFSADLTNHRKHKVENKKSLVTCPAITAFDWARDSQSMIGTSTLDSSGCIASMFATINLYKPSRTLHPNVGELQYGDTTYNAFSQSYEPSRLIRTLSNGDWLYVTQRHALVKLNKRGKTQKIFSTRAKWPKERWLGLFSSHQGDKIRLKVVNPEIEPPKVFHKLDEVGKPGRNGNLFIEYQFDVRKRSLVTNPTDSETVYPRLKRWKNLSLKTEPKPNGGMNTAYLNGQKFMLEDVKLMTSSAKSSIDPVGRQFVTELNSNKVVLFKKPNVAGREINTGNAQITTLNTSRNGEFVITIHVDGVIAWHRLDDGSEVLRLFVHEDNKRWVMWTPEGFFDHSPGGEELVGFHVNNGRDKNPDFIEVSRLYDLFYRPDLVQKKFSGLDDLVQQELAKIGTAARTIAAGLPPEITLPQGPDAGITRQSNWPVQVIITEQGGGAGKVVYRVNGVTAAISQANQLTKGSGKQLKLTQQLTLQPGENKIEVSVFNQGNHIESKTSGLTVNNLDTQTVQAKLFVIAVGVNQYTGTDIQPLDYAVPDTQLLLNTLKKQGKAIYNNITVVKRVDATANINGIREAFNNIASIADANDRALSNRAAQGRISRATGRAVLSGSTSVQAALEGYKGHGVFSYVLSEALSGSGDKRGNRDGKISVVELADFAGNEVPNITRTIWNENQTPVFSLKGNDFVLSSEQ